MSEAEREQLERWTRRRKTAPGVGVVEPDRVGFAKGENNTRVAEQLGVSVPTVRKWRGRFASERLDGLGSCPCPVCSACDPTACWR